MRFHFNVAIIKYVFLVLVQETNSISIVPEQAFLQELLLWIGNAVNSLCRFIFIFISTFFLSFSTFFASILAKICRCILSVSCIGPCVVFLWHCLHLMNLPQMLEFNLLCTAPVAQLADTLSLYSIFFSFHQLCVNGLGYWTVNLFSNDLLILILCLEGAGDCREVGKGGIPILSNVVARRLFTCLLSNYTVTHLDVRWSISYISMVLQRSELTEEFFGNWCLFTNRAQDSELP